MSATLLPRFAMNAQLRGIFLPNTATNRAIMKASKRRPSPAPGPSKLLLLVTTTPFPLRRQRFDSRIIPSDLIRVSLAQPGHVDLEILCHSSLLHPVMHNSPEFVEHPQSLRQPLLDSQNGIATVNGNWPDK